MSETIATNVAPTGRQLLERASNAPGGKAIQNLHAASDGALTQILLALTAGRELSEHENPGHATLHILSGSMRLTAGPTQWELSPGEHIVVPRRRHGLLALEDSTAILTIAKAP